jgi:hypothetical protein
MAATLSTIAPYLKEVYEGRIREQLNNEVVTLKRITKTGSGVTNETGGKYVTFPVHTRRNSGIGSRNEMDALPTPGNQSHAAARIGLKYMYGGMQLTGQAISLADTDAKAFAKAVDVEADGLKNDLKKDMNRQIYGDGTGRIGTVSAVVTSTTIPVSDARLFQIGEQVDLITLPSTVAASNRIINSVDLTSGANTVTISGANVTSVVGQIFVRTGSVNKEITGLAAIVDNSGTLYNIDPSTEPEWKSTIFDNGGTPRALSEALMIQMADEIRTRGGSTSVIFQSLGVRRAYFNLLSQTRSTVNEQKFTGGFTGLAFTTDQGEIPAVADVDAPLGQQTFLNESNIKFYRDEEWHYLDRDGSMWKQVRDSSGVYDAWFATMVEYHELGTDRRNTHGRIEDLIEN